MYVKKNEINKKKDLLNKKHNRSPLKERIEETILHENGIRKQNEKIEKINYLLSQIQVEIKKIVICLLCKRKFANQAHYLRHCSFSILHRHNVQNS